MFSLWWVSQFIESSSWKILAAACQRNQGDISVAQNAEKYQKRRKSDTSNVASSDNSLSQSGGRIEK